MNVVPREELNTSFKPGLVSIIQIICLTGGRALGNAFLSKEMRKAGKLVRPPECFIGRKLQDKLQCC